MTKAQMQELLLSMQAKMNTLEEENKKLQEKEAIPEAKARFNLIPSKNRTSEKSPHYFGSVKIDDVWYQVSTWVNAAQGTKGEYLHNALTEMTEERAKEAQEREDEFTASAPVELSMSGKKTKKAPVVADESNPF